MSESDESQLPLQIESKRITEIEWEYCANAFGYTPEEIERMKKMEEDDLKDPVP